MNLLPYLPPLLSIYLLLISGASSGYIKNRLRQFIAGDEKLQARGLTVEHLTLDWAARLGFFNSMFAAMASSLSIWSKTGDLQLAGLTVFVLLLIFIPMMWWINGLEVDELVASMSRKGHVKPATVCRIVLIVVNLGLILAIMFSERLSAQPRTRQDRIIRTRQATLGYANILPRCAAQQPVNQI